MSERVRLVQYWCSCCKRVVVEAPVGSVAWCKCGRRCKVLAPPVRLPKTPQARGRGRAANRQGGESVQTVLSMGRVENF